MPIRRLDGVLDEVTAALPLQPEQPGIHLKIDVQGFELQVLEGAAGILRRDRPVVIIERDARVEARIREWMEGLGYSATILAMNAIYTPLAEPGAPRG